MNILKKGRDLSPKGLPWYVSTPIICPRCDCTFEIGPYDSIECRYPDYGSTPYSCRVECPNKTCGYPMSISHNHKQVRAR